MNCEAGPLSPRRGRADFEQDFMRTNVALLLVLASVGCGGGGGGDGGASTGPTGTLWFGSDHATSTVARVELLGELAHFADPSETHVAWTNAATGGAGSGGSRLVEETHELLGYVWT